MLAMVMPLLLIASGCQNCCTFKDSQPLGLFSRNSEPDLASLLNSDRAQLDRSGASIEQRLAILSGDPLPENKLAANTDFQTGNPTTSQYTQTGYAAGGRVNQDFAPQQNNQPIIRTQSLDYFGFPETASTKETLVSNAPQQVENLLAQESNSVVQAGDAAKQQGNGLIQQGANLIGTSTADASKNVKSAFQLPGILDPIRNRLPRNSLPISSAGVSEAINPDFPANYADLDVYVAETQTGRINFGGAFNSDNGIVGQFSIDEKNFDITRWPRNFREIIDGTAWRGAGQQFRLELAPGNEVERYLVSFTEPYWLGTNYSFSASAYLFQRRFFDWDEKRVGGRFSLGRRLTPHLSISGGLRLERVKLDEPRVDTSAQLNENLGDSHLYVGNIGLIRDTRDSQTQPTEGSYMALTYSQAFGDFDYARGDFDYRRYRLLYERPDGSGRHTISFGTKLGFTGSDTPVFENYFAGGFATLRGFDFRGASPLDGGARVGGEFQWLNTVEYTFPIRADDSIKGVVFCDFGTVEQEVEINSENFRVAPGIGLRVSAPGIGLGAPLAFDFAFPVATADGDDERIFSFYLGVQR